MTDQPKPITDAPVVRVIPDFDRFYRSEFSAVAGLAYALSGSRLGAEDIAQEAFLAAYRRWDEIGRYDNPGAWVRRVVANRSVSAIRRRTVEARAFPVWYGVMKSCPNCPPNRSRCGGRSAGSPDARRK